MHEQANTNKKSKYESFIEQLVKHAKPDRPEKHFNEQTSLMKI